MVFSFQPPGVLQIGPCLDSPEHKKVGIPRARNTFRPRTLPDRSMSRFTGAQQNWNSSSEEHISPPESSRLVHVSIHRSTKQFEFFARSTFAPGASQIGPCLIAKQKQHSHIETQPRSQTAAQPNRNTARQQHSQTAASEARGQRPEASGRRPEAGGQRPETRG